MADNFDLSDSVAHVNLCGFGKTVIQTALEGNSGPASAGELLRTHAPSIRSGERRRQRALHLPHGPAAFGRPVPDRRACTFAEALKNAYERSSGTIFDLKACQAAFKRPEPYTKPYVGVLGVRAGTEMEQMIEDTFDLPSAT